MHGRRVGESDGAGRISDSKIMVRSTTTLRFSVIEIFSRLAFLSIVTASTGDTSTITDLRAHIPFLVVLCIATAMPRRIIVTTIAIFPRPFALRHQ